jgi:hypothetical protein
MNTKEHESKTVGARRSRRFNAQMEDELDTSRAIPQWTLKRAEARAPLKHSHLFVFIRG